MKKLLFVLASAFLMLSCSQEEEVIPIGNNQKELPELTTAQAQLKFAKLLSKAASNSIEVRKFLKEQALLQFDKDNDVFYPLVKDKIITEGQTFRDILLSYCENENELAQIEQSQLLLNILVPDLSLFWDFNAKTWDINNKEISVLCRDDKDNTLYEDGEIIGNLPKGEIPGFPCLVVKTNERLKVANVNSRSGEVSYEFISDVFDGTKTSTPQSRHSDFDLDWEKAEDLDAYVKGDAVLASVKEAWKEFKDVSEAYQRDYVYYGITKANKPGTLNRNIREKLYRFRIVPAKYGDIADSSNDPKLNNPTQTKRYLTNAELLQQIWTEGNFEFRFKTYVAGEKDKAPMEANYNFSVKPREAFSIEKIHVHHKNSTMFRQSKNFYSVDVNNLKSKWIYPETLEKESRKVPVFLLPWDLFSTSFSIHMFVQEYDPEQVQEVTRTVVNSFTNKADFALDGSGTAAGIKIGAKLGYGFSYTTTTTSSTKVTTTLGSDDLGTLSFFFSDPIIKHELNGTYDLYNVSSGSVEATIMPMDIRE